MSGTPPADDPLQPCALLAQGMEKGIEKGMEKGHQQACQWLFQLQLKRPLTEAEERVIAERTARLGVERIKDLVMASTAEQCAAWLADAQAR